MYESKLIEKLHGLESSTSNFALLTFCTEVTNRILELEQGLSGAEQRIHELDLELERHLNTIE